MKENNLPVFEDELRVVYLFELQGIVNSNQNIFLELITKVTEISDFYETLKLYKEAFAYIKLANFISEVIIDFVNSSSNLETYQNLRDLQIQKISLLEAKIKEDVITKKRRFSSKTRNHLSNLERGFKDFVLLNKDVFQQLVSKIQQMSELLMRQSLFAEALKILKQMKILKKIFLGRKHVEVMEAYFLIAYANYRLNNFDETLLALSTTYDKFKTLPIFSLNILKHLESEYVEKDNFKNAFTCSYISLALRNNHYGTRSREVVLNLGALGIYYSLLGNNQESFKCLSLAEELCEGVSGNGFIKALTYKNIGEVFSLIENYSAALTYFDKAFNLFSILGYYPNRSQVAVRMYEITVKMQQTQVFMLTSIEYDNDWFSTKKFIQLKNDYFAYFTKIINDWLDSEGFFDYKNLSNYLTASLIIIDNFFACLESDKIRFLNLRRKYDFPPNDDDFPNYNGNYANNVSKPVEQIDFSPVFIGEISYNNSITII